MSLSFHKSFPLIPIAQTPFPNASIISVAFIYITRTLGNPLIDPINDLSDFEIIFNDAPASITASRGQSRIISLSLKLSEAKEIKNKQQKVLVISNADAIVDPGTMVVKNLKNKTRKIQWSVLYIHNGDK